MLAFGASQPTRAFFVRDAGGTPLVQFQSDGNVLVLKGAFLQNQAAIPATSAREFIVKNGEGVIVTKINGSSGDFLIKQSMVINGSLATSSSKELVIRNFSDPSGYAQIIIDASGYLRLRGNVYTNQDL